MYRRASIPVRAVRLAVAAGVAAALIGGCTSTTASQGPSPDGPTPSASPTSAIRPTDPAPTTEPGHVVTSVLFNNPWSALRSQQFRLQDREVRAINGAPAGSSISIATYSLSSGEVGDALVAAYHRGVRVRLNIDPHANFIQTRRLVRLLGTDQARKSYVVRCHLACATDVTYPRRDGAGLIKPYQHAKFLAFSRTGSERNLVMFPSENLSPSAIEQSNDMIVLSGSRAVYDFVVERFAIMSKDAGSAEGEVTSGSATVTMYPVKLGAGAEPSPDLDPYWALFKNITCRVGGKSTVIRVAMSMWSLPRLYLAERVAELSRQGCRFLVIGQPEIALGGWDPEIKAALLVRGSTVRLRQTTGGKWVHSKIVTIDGWDAGGARLVMAWTNSANFLLQGLYYNDEIGILTTDPAAIRTYNRHIEGALFTHSRPVAR